MSRILTFVLNSHSGSSFIADFHEQINFITGTNAILLMKASLFIDILNTNSPDWEFRLVFHEGISNRGGYSRSDSLISELERELPFIRKNKFVFLTRQQELFPNQEPMIEDDLGIHLNFNKSNFEKIVDDLIVYKKSDFTSAPRSLPPPVILESNEFAVLTALYDHEHTVFKSHCTLHERSDVYNSSYATFNKKVVLPHGEDYNKKFLVFHQQQMGLVDAAIHATQAVTLNNPHFLLMPGVCGGKKGVTRRYDIIIPSIVHDYATGKFKDGKLESLGYKSPANPALYTELKNHKSAIIANMRKLIDEDREGLLSKDFDIHFKEFACGPWVVKTEGALAKISDGEIKKFNTKKANKDFVDGLPVSRINANVVGLEMESYSILRTSEILQEANHYALVVKSVMDFTNELKDDGENQEIKSSAAYVSYLCVRALMPILLEIRNKLGRWKK